MLYHAAVGCLSYLAQAHVIMILFRPSYLEY